MSMAVLITGAIGEGKTTACLELAERCRRGGFKVYGIVSPRAFQDGALIGYDCLDISSREEFPLVRLKKVVEGLDWFHFKGLKYAFSTIGFERANSILLRSSEALDRLSVIFIDEFGRLEAAGRGLLPGILNVVERIRRGGIAVFTCRPELRGSLEKLLEDEKINFLYYTPADLEEAWVMIQDYLTGTSTTSVI